MHGPCFAKYDAPLSREDRVGAHCIRLPGSPGTPTARKYARLSLVDDSCTNNCRRCSIRPLRPPNELVKPSAMRLVPAVLGRAISREAGPHQHFTISKDPLWFFEPGKAQASLSSPSHPRLQDGLNTLKRSIAVRGRLLHVTQGREDIANVNSAQRNNGARIC